MTDKFHIRKALRVIDAEVDPEQAIFAVNPLGDQKCYIFDGTQIREIEFGAVNNSTATKPMVVAADVSGSDPDLERFSGTATTGSGTTITLPTGATESSADDDFHIGSLIQLTGGTGSGQNQRITDYDGTTRVATVAAFAPSPSTDTTYEINCTNFHTDAAESGIAVQRGLVIKPLTGQNIIDGDTNLYPMRIRVHPRIVDEEGTRYPSILFKAEAVTESADRPGYGRWEWLINYKNIPSRGYYGPFLFNEFPHQLGREMTADISDVVVSPSAAAIPGWIEFTLTITSVENGTAVWGQAETMGVS